MLKKDYSQKNFSNPLHENVKIENKLPKWGRRLVYICFGTLLIGGFIFLFLFSPWTRIKKFVIKNTSNPDVTIQAEQWLKTQSHVRRARFVRGDNMLVADIAGLDRMLSELLYVKSVSIKKEWPDTVIIEITDKETSLIYTLNHRHIILDSEGNPIEAVAENNLPAAMPRLYGTTTDDTISQELPAIDGSLVRFVKQLSLEFPRLIKELTILDYTLVSSNSSELIARPDRGPRILFDANKDMQVQLSNLSRAVAEIIGNENLYNIQYIDVRLENYIYYK